jgi:ATP-dependent RNA helicase RhlE
LRGDVGAKEHYLTPSFDTLGLAEPLRLALKAEKYLTPTPIQVQAIPILTAGNDLLGVAETGSGKTAAFSLPLLHNLFLDHSPRVPGAPRALILAPTRELAGQIGDRVNAYGRHLKMRSAVIFGGVGQGQQVKALKAGVDILIATPGRLLDLCNQRHVRLDKVQILVLDEADRMLDMGFIHDVRKIVGFCRKERQTLLFSATMPPSIAKLAQDILRDPIRVDISQTKVAVDRIEQRVYFVGASDKRTLLTDLLKAPTLGQTIVFTRTKRGADRVCRHLSQNGVAAAAIHGNKAQNARVRALSEFRTGRVQVLVATDIAARGIDVPGISHVINYELPNEPESYVHRIGRTARAGARGIAISLCDPSERSYLKAIERLMRINVEVSQHHLANTRDVPAPEMDGGAPARKSPKGRRRFRGRRPDVAAAGAARRPNFSNAQRRMEAPL